MCTSCIPHREGDPTCPCVDCFDEKMTALCPMSGTPHTTKNGKFITGEHPEHCPACYDGWCCWRCDAPDEPNPTGYLANGTPCPVPKPVEWEAYRR